MAKSNSRKGIEAIQALADHVNSGSDDARPVVTKQDISEARGGRRTGLPRAIKSAKGVTIAERIVIAPPMIQRVELWLKGKSSLIENGWSWKTIQKLMRDHMQLEPPTPKISKKPKDRHGKAHDAKDPFQIFLNSMYEHPAGGWGFPNNGIKKALITACSFTSGISPKMVSGAVTVLNELSQIYGPVPHPRFDMVKVTDKYGKESPDTRFRGEFEAPWAIRLDVEYAEAIIGLTDLVNLFMWAGNSVGIGEWRKEKDGNFGLFTVASEAEVKEIKRTLKVPDRKKLTEDNSGINAIYEKYRIFDWEEEPAA